ncbi:hypothetical protein J3A83DRAFT_4372073 [Scleroderma citrinum]
MTVVEGKIDFVGQKRVDDISRVVLVAATVGGLVDPGSRTNAQQILSFAAGFALDSLRASMQVFGLSALALLVVSDPAVVE